MRGSEAMALINFSKGFPVRVKARQGRSQVRASEPDLRNRRTHTLAKTRFVGGG